MPEKILFIASAPLDNVLRIASELEKTRIGAELTLLVKQARSKQAAASLQGWNILTYECGNLTPWNESLPDIEILRAAAADGAYYACATGVSGEYFYLELLARRINSEEARAIVVPVRVLNVAPPGDAMNMLLAGNISGARAAMEDFYKRNAIENAVHSTNSSLPPQSALIMLDSICNYRCVMCAFYDETLAKSNPAVPQSYMTGKRKMELQDYYMLVDQLSEMGVNDIQISAAGEPLLDRRFPEILKHIEKAGMNCSIGTNGYPLDKKTRQAIISTGVKHITVSLNAGKPETFARIHNIPSKGFSTVVSNVKHLIDERDAAGLCCPIVMLSFVISKINIGDVNAIFETGEKVRADKVLLRPVQFSLDNPSTDIALDENDVHNIAQQAAAFNASKNISFTPKVMVATEKGSHDIDSRKAFFSEGPCYMGWTFAVVTNFGDVLPCCACSNRLGNALEKPFAEIWNGPEYIRMREKMLSLPESGEPISGCDCYTACPHVLEISIVRNKIHRMSSENNRTPD